MGGEVELKNLELEIKKAKGHFINSDYETTRETGDETDSGYKTHDVVQILLPKGVKTVTLPQSSQSLAKKQYRDYYLSQTDINEETESDMAGTMSDNRHSLSQQKPKQKRFPKNQKPANHAPNTYAGKLLAPKPNKPEKNKDDWSSIAPTLGDLNENRQFVENELFEGAGDFKQQRKQKILEHQNLPQRKQQNHDANLFRNKYQNLNIQQPKD